MLHKIKSAFILSLFAALFLASGSVAATKGKSIGTKQGIFTSGERYSGNVKTLKFHNEQCKFFNCRDCTKYFTSREAAMKAGYKACGKCGG